MSILTMHHGLMAGIQKKVSHDWLYLSYFGNIVSGKDVPIYGSNQLSVSESRVSTRSTPIGSVPCLLVSEGFTSSTETITGYDGGDFTMDLFCEGIYSAGTDDNHKFTDDVYLRHHFLSDIGIHLVFQGLNPTTNFTNYRCSNVSVQDYQSVKAVTGIGQSHGMKHVAMVYDSIQNDVTVYVDGLRYVRVGGFIHPQTPIISFSDYANAKVYFTQVAYRTGKVYTGDSFQVPNTPYYPGILGA